MITAFAFFGQQILSYLHISLPALQCAGGLLLLLVALELLTGNEDDPTPPPDVNVALVPLGTPLLAGPGAIVATMVFVQAVDDAQSFAAVPSARRSCTSRCGPRCASRCRSSRSSGRAASCW